MMDEVFEIAIRELEPIQFIQEFDCSRRHMRSPELEPPPEADSVAPDIPTVFLRF